MLTKEFKLKILRDLHIPYQEQDARVAFSNPSDAARVFIKANNWSGRIVEELVGILEAKRDLLNELRNLRATINKTERNVMKGISTIPTAASKNKELFSDWLFTKANEEQSTIITKTVDRMHELGNQLESLNQEETQLNMLLKEVERACDRSTQYVNWCKYEARENDPRR